MALQLKEVEAITGSAEPATFENTIVAMEKSGQMLGRAAAAFYNLTGSNTNDSLQAIKVEMAPKLAAHGDAISLDPKLFTRIKTLYDERSTLGLDPVSERLLERYYTRFVRAGALLDETAKTQMKKLNEEEAGLKTKFEDNILKERTALAVVVVDVKQLDGFTPDAIEAAAASAKEKGQEGKWLIDLRNTTSQPALTDLKDRALRERIFKASISRNSRGGEYDNSEIITRLAQLRAEIKLLGSLLGCVRMDDQCRPCPARQFIRWPCSARIEGGTRKMASIANKRRWTKLKLGLGLLR